MTTDLAPSSAASRLLLPSITDLIFMLLLISFTYGKLSPRLLWDADVGWHIRNGENILATHVIPRTDSFSATMSGQTWYAWEWLFDLLIGTVHRYMGLNGVVFVSAVIISFTLALIFRTSVKRGGVVPFTVVLFLLCLVSSSIHFLARPHVISWLFGVFWFRVLDGFQGDHRAGRLWIFPLLMVVWANLHGGFVLGFVLLGIYLVALVIEFARAQRDKELRQRAGNQAQTLLVVTAVCGIASLVNPYGYKLHVHVYRYLTNRFFMQHIDEFRAANLRGLPAEFFLLLIAMVVVGVFVARLRLSWSEWMLIAFGAFSGLWAARNIPFASMLLTMISAPLFSRGVEGERGRFAVLRNMNFGQFDLKLRGHLWPVVLLAFSVAVCIQGGRIFGSKWMDAHFDSKRLPVKAVDEMARVGDREPVFSLDSWGGYFIYRRYPEQKVFIDDRHDFYGEAYIREYLTVLHVEPGWDQVLQKRGVKLVVFPTKSNLSEALRQAGWKVSYQDDVAVVLVR